MSQRTGIHSHKSVLRLHALQVNHCGFDVAMTQPSLQSSNIDSMAQVFRGEGVAELVEEKVLAMGPLGAAIAMPGFALTAIQLGSFGNLFHDHVILAVGVTLRVREHKL